MSELVTQLLNALASGSVTRFGDLPPEQIAELTAEFGRGPFSDEHRAVMAGLVLVASGKEEEISAFNASSPVHKICPMPLADGDLVLPVSLLTWAGRGQGFCGAWELFLSMPVRRVTAADWPVTEDESND